LKRLRRKQQGFIQMFNALRRMATLGASMVIILLAAANAAYAQAPTEAQRSAIRSHCRADYQAHCSSVPPGGKASLQCLQQNMSSLSSACQTAVRAVEAPAAPKAETAPVAPAESAPAAATAKPAAETAAPPPAPNAAAKNPAPKAASTRAKKPSSAQVAAIRSACRSDYQENCAGVPTGGAAALSCLQKNKANLSANCQKAVSAAGNAAAPEGGEAAAPETGGAPADAATAGPATAPTLVLRPMRPREVVFVLRSACGEDVRSLCAGVPAGGGRIIQCLATQAASLSPACADVLGQFTAR
jgi:Cysteine rich repeat